MAYRVTANGHLVEMDTLVELEQYLRRLSEGAIPPGNGGSGSIVSSLKPRRKQASSVRVFQNETERQALGALLTSQSGVPMRRLAEILETSPIGLRGFMSKWSKRAKTNDRNLNSLLQRRRSYSRGKVEVTYVLTEAGRQYFDTE